jgi:hypothetical protein
MVHLVKITSLSAVILELYRDNTDLKEEGTTRDGALGK